MTLSAGTRLGPYELVAQIGVGGRGEVYRATDTVLKRQVAIKVLPESVATDSERLARFQREAEVLTALNHPNIAQIYGVETSNGITALVMELVDGPTLDELIRQGQPETASGGERFRAGDSAVRREGPQPAASGVGPELDDTRRVTPLLQSRFAERNGVISPDGHWLAYESNDSGRFEIYVRPYPKVNGSLSVVSTEGGTRPTWARNGQELFYVSPTGALMRVGVTRGASWSATKPSVVVKEGYFTNPVLGEPDCCIGDRLALRIHNPPRQEFWRWVQFEDKGVLRSCSCASVSSNRAKAEYPKSG